MSALSVVELLGVALVVVEPARLQVPDVEATAIGADPHVAGAIARQRGDAAARQVQAVFGAGPQVLEAARARVEARDAAAEGADPELLVDLEQAHHAGGARAWSARPGSCWNDFGTCSVCGSMRLRPPPMVPTQMSPSLAFEHGHDAVVAQASCARRSRGAPGVTWLVVRSSRLMPLPKVPIHRRPSLSSANEVMLRSVKPSSALARKWPNDQVRGFHLARPPDLVPIHSEPPRSSNSETT